MSIENRSKANRRKGLTKSQVKLGCIRHHKASGVTGAAAKGLNWCGLGPSWFYTTLTSDSMFSIFSGLQMWLSSLPHTLSAPCTLFNIIQIIAVGGIRLRDVGEVTLIFLLHPPKVLPKSYDSDSAVIMHSAAAIFRKILGKTKLTHWVKIFCKYVVWPNFNVGISLYTGAC